MQKSWRAVASVAPFALGEGSQLRMGTLVYGATTVGQGCKMGGELSNVVVHDWSNKAHGGFLGNAVLGSWCNLGAETTCSNLKNTYGVIAEWCEDSQSFEPKGRQFCGLLMGDHSKTAIHTAFSTATVLGSWPMCLGSGRLLATFPASSGAWTATPKSTLTKALTWREKSWRAASKPCPPARNMPFGHSFRNKSAKLSQQVGWHGV